jgi:putative ABC transport system permease protein
VNYRKFIYRNALRNKRRTGLTILSIAFSLFLLMALLTFMKSLLNPVVEEMSALRLITSGASSLAEMLPIAYMDKIKRIPGVVNVSPLQWFNGMYKDPKYMFANFATDPRTIFEIYSEQKITPETRAAFIARRDGAVAGDDLMERFGWKAGDRITLTGTTFPVDMELTIVGSFHFPDYQNVLYFRYDYLNEAMGNFNQVGAYVVRTTDAGVVPVVGETIDAMFRNSTTATKTDSEKAFVLGFISMLGNVQGIIASVAGVVVFAMLLVAVSTMSMTVRERMREVAILKAIGYRRRTVLALVMGEALLISMAGAFIGMGMGELLRFADMDKATQGFITRYNPSPLNYLAVVAAGVVIGLVAGFIPAWQAAKMSITGAMRRME